MSKLWPTWSFVSYPNLYQTQDSETADKTDPGKVNNEIDFLVYQKLIFLQMLFSIYATSEIITTVIVWSTYLSAIILQMAISVILLLFWSRFKHNYCQLCRLSLSWRFITFLSSHTQNSSNILRGPRKKQLVRSICSILGEEICCIISFFTLTTSHIHPMLKKTIYWILTLD